MDDLKEYLLSHSGKKIDILFIGRKKKEVEKALDIFFHVFKKTCTSKESPYTKTKKISLENIVDKVLFSLFLWI